MHLPDDDLGGRLPLLDPATLTETQRQFYDAAMSAEYPWSLSTGFQFVTHDRRLIGPHNAFLRRPQIAEKFQEFAKAASQLSSLSPQLREVVILAVGSAWDSKYEVYAHRIVAEAAGIPAADAAALATGQAPTRLGRDAEVTFALVRQLTVDHQVDQDLYDEAVTIFGEEGVFDIVAVMGAYLVVSSFLNVFDVPAPE
jgi:4-carboxymuconolactone decarboxylase